jgi:hypothetical protein
MPPPLRWICMWGFQNAPGGIWEPETLRSGGDGPALRSAVRLPKVVFRSAFRNMPNCISGTTPLRFGPPHDGGQSPLPRSSRPGTAAGPAGDTAPRRELLASALRERCARWRWSAFPCGKKPIRPLTSERQGGCLFHGIPEVSLHYICSLPRQGFSGGRPRDLLKSPRRSKERTPPASFRMAPRAGEEQWERRPGGACNLCDSGKSRHAAPLRPARFARKPLGRRENRTDRPAANGMR